MEVSANATPYKAHRTRKRAEKEQTIFRAPRDEDHPYTIISAKLGQDRSISFAARGMMLYVLSKPDTWLIRVGDLMKQGCGRDAIKKLLRELEGAGYLVRDDAQSRHENGVFAERVWRVHESPSTENPSAVNPSTVFPLPVHPSTENPPLVSIESSKELNQQESNNVNPESSSADERDFLLEIQNEFKKFKKLETHLRVQLERVGRDVFAAVVERCKRYGAKSWGYILSALECEAPISPSPSFASPLPEIPANFMPEDEYDPRRKLFWREDYLHMKNNEPHNFGAWMAQWTQPAGVMA